MVTEHEDFFRATARVLTSSADLERVLVNTISACLPHLADFGFFDMFLDDGVRRTARAHQQPELEVLLQSSQWERTERTDINLCALSSGLSALHPNTDDKWYAAAFNTPRNMSFHSMISVPVAYGKDLVGALTLFMADSNRRHDQEYLRLAEEVATLAAPIVMNARLVERERRAQIALKQSENRLRLATEAGKIGIWEWDIPSNSVSWSKQVYELHGLPQGQFGGTVEDFAALVHPHDQAATLQHITEALVDAKTLTDEFRTIWPDGSVHWLTTSSYIDRDDSGQAVRMVGSVIDITEQKNLQFNLQDLNTQLSQQTAVITSERDRIWQISQDILAVASFSGYYISVNPAFTKILGWDDKEILSVPFMALCHPDQREEASQALSVLAAGVKVENFEIQSLHKNGTYKWLSWTVIAEGDSLYAVGRDVTEIRQEREGSLLATEKRFQLALSAGGMGAWQWDLINGEIHWWPGMAEIHGLSQGTKITRVEDYLQFVHPDDVPILMSSRGDVTAFREFINVEYRIVWPDGSIHWIEGRREQILNNEGIPIQVAGICLDITERKLTEQNLRFLAEASAEVADLVDHEDTLKKVAQLAVPTFADWCSVDLLDENDELKRVAVCHVDPTKVALAHELHEKYPPNRTLPSGAWKVITSGQAELVTEISDELLREFIKDEAYLNIVRQLGLRSYIGVPLLVRGKTLGVVTFISAESKRIYGPKDVALASDIGKRAAVAIENSNFYRALKDADRRKDDFLAMLAHELRNPLAPIKVAADLLNLPLTPERLKKTSEIVSRQVNHMTGLLDDLLDVSRVTRGQVPIEKKPVELHAVIHTAIEQVRPLIDAKKHQLSVQLGDEKQYIKGDEKRLVQVIANLLTNAAKFTPQQGHVKIIASTANQEVDIRIHDNGIGMAPELLATAFELFVQGKRAADRSQGGLGLGLALVKNLVTLHNGTVNARSKGEGLGSEFILRFPLISHIEKSPAIAQGSTESSPEESLNILIVDDNRDAADTLKLFVQALGHQVHIVYDPYDALAKTENTRFDTVLLDIGLPGMDGYELAKQIRAKLNALTPTLIAISGYGQPSDRDAAFAVGIDHYFVKPLDVKNLVSLLTKNQTIK